MNHYDDEEKVIDYLQSITFRRICFIKPRAETLKFFFSLKSERSWLFVTCESFHKMAKTKAFL